MQLGLSSYTFAWAIGVPGKPQPARLMTPMDLINRAAELGVHLVQIADNMPLHLLDAGARRALKKHAAGHHIVVEVGTRGIKTDHIREYIEIAREFESPILRVVIDTADHHPAVEDVIEYIRSVLPELQENNIILAIENHDRFTTEIFLHIMRTLNVPQVGICLDTVNSFGALEGPEIVVERLAPWAVNLHVKDFEIRRADHALGFSISGAPAGSGRLNVPWLLAQIAGHGRELNAIIELWPPLDADIEVTVSREANWAAQSVQYMRRFIAD